MTTVFVKSVNMLIACHAVLSECQLIAITHWLLSCMPQDFAYFVHSFDLDISGVGAFLCINESWKKIQAEVIHGTYANIFVSY